MVIWLTLKMERIIFTNGKCGPREDDYYVQLPLRKWRKLNKDTIL